MFKKRNHNLIIVIFFNNAVSEFDKKNNEDSPSKIRGNIDDNYGNEIKGEIERKFKSKNENLKNSWKKINFHLENDLLIRNVVPGPFNSSRLVKLKLEKCFLYILFFSIFSK